MGIAGDFSLINPYGVRVRVIQSSGSGLRVFQDSGLGLRVRLPDSHVILLISLYLTGMILLLFSPHPLLPLHHWSVIHSPTTSTENDYPHCAICWWDGHQPSFFQCPPPIGRFLSLWLIWQVILIEPLLESYLQINWEGFLHPPGTGQCHWLSGGISPTPDCWYGV